MRWRAGLMVVLSLHVSGTALADLTKQDCTEANVTAQSLRREGKLRAARDALATCASPVCPDAVRADCLERTEAISQTMPTIVLAAKDGAGNDLAAVSVTIDGDPFAEALDGKALDVDSGEHEFVFTATGQAPVTRRFVIREGEKARRESIVIGTAPPPPPIVQPPVNEHPDAVLFHLHRPADAEKSDVWTLRDKKGASRCTLPCDSWISANSGWYMNRGDGRRVDVPPKLGSPIGSAVTATPKLGWEQTYSTAGWTMLLLGAGGAAASLAVEVKANPKDNNVQIGAGIAGVAALGLAIWGYWWADAYASNPTRLVIAPPRKASFHVSPFGLRLDL